MLRATTTPCCCVGLEQLQVCASYTRLSPEKCWCGSLLEGALENPGTLPASVHCACLCVLSVPTGLILPAEEGYLVGCMCRL